MSAFTLESAQIERSTAVHQASSAAILNAAVRHDPAIQTVGFPVSGDMIAVINQGTHGQLERRRRRAARVCAEHEVFV